MTELWDETQEPRAVTRPHLKKSEKRLRAKLPPPYYMLFVPKGEARAPKVKHATLAGALDEARHLCEASGRTVYVLVAVGEVVARKKSDGGGIERISALKVPRVVTANVPDLIMGSEE